MGSPLAFFRRTFTSLSIRNYRLYFIGQGISGCGSWMQTVAQGLLVLKLTGSGTALGLIIALQMVPMLVLGPWGGVVADRYPKRKILYCTQAAGGILGLTMATLVLSGWIQLWMVFLMGVLLGFQRVFDQPTQQTFVREMVGTDYLANAISLNAMEMNVARVIGPTIAGVLVATVGLGACFLIDGLSYGIVIIALSRMRQEELRPAPQVARARGQLVAGFRYVRSSTVLTTLLLMMAIVGMLTYEFSVVLPLLSEFTLHGGASGYAALTAAMGAGSVIGGFYAASRRSGNPRKLAFVSIGFGCSLLLVAAAPNLPLAVVGMLVVGFCSINFTSLGNVSLQMEARPDMQGRVMALYSVAFVGTTPIGGPIQGWIGEHAGARWSLMIGAMAAFTAATLGFWASRKIEVRRPATESLPHAPAEAPAELEPSRPR
jgi:MFS family permease